MYANLHRINPPSVSDRPSPSSIGVDIEMKCVLILVSPAVLPRFRVSSIVIVDGHQIAAVSGGPGLATGNNEVMAAASASLD